MIHDSDGTTPGIFLIHKLVILKRDVLVWIVQQPCKQRHQVSFCPVSAWTEWTAALHTEPTLLMCHSLMTKQAAHIVKKIKHFFIHQKNI